jgi:hypothetical protein
VEIRNTSVTEEYELQLKQQHERGLCTTPQFDDATKTWLWCQNRQHTRGRRKKCLDCLAASDDLNERLLAQGFCKCKLDHPAGRGCPDRFLREGRIHLISEEQSRWYWKQILTANGKIDPFDPNLTRGQRAYVTRWANNLFALFLNPPSQLADIDVFVRRYVTNKRKISRTQRNWAIVIATFHYSMWNDPKLDLKGKVQLAQSKAIKDGMDAARLAGRLPGRPRKTKIGR